MLSVFLLECFLLVEVERLVDVEVGDQSSLPRPEEYCLEPSNDDKGRDKEDNASMKNSGVTESVADEADETAEKAGNC